MARHGPATDPIAWHLGEQAGMENRLLATEGAPGRGAAGATPPRIAPATYGACHPGSELLRRPPRGEGERRPLSGPAHVWGDASSPRDGRLTPGRSWTRRRARPRGDGRAAATRGAERPRAQPQGSSGSLRQQASCNNQVSFRETRGVGPTGAPSSPSTPPQRESCRQPPAWLRAALGSSTQK